MAKWLGVAVALLLLGPSLVLAQAPSVCSIAGRPLVYVGDNDFPPYEYLDADGKPTGFNIQLVEALAHALGLTVEFRLLPWEEARRAREAGTADLFSAGYAPEREADFDFLAPTTTVRSSLLMKPGGDRYPETGSDVAGLRIAVQDGAPSIQNFERLPAGKRPVVIATPSHRASIALLQSGEVDAAAGSGATLRWHASDAGLFAPVEVPMNSRPYMLATKKGCGPARQALADAVSVLKEQGVIDQIADRMLTDPPNRRRWTWNEVVLVIGLIGSVLIGAVAWNWALRRTVRARTRALRSALSEQERLTEVIRSNEGRLAFAMDVIGEGAWEWDLASNRIHASTRWARSFGYRPEEAPTNYENWMALVHPDDRERVAAAARAHIEGSAPRYEATYRVPRKDSGEWIWVVDRGRIVRRDDTGKPLRMIGTLKDITIQLAAERALHEAKDAAEATSRAKSAFLATISHEMRTPLNAVIGTAGLLEHTSLTDEQRELLHLLKRSSDSLLAVVNDVLDFTKIEAGRIELDERAFDLQETVRESVSLVEQAARAKGLQLQVTFDSHAAVWVHGDDTRFRQILLNLVANAVKFTEEGRVDVEVSADGTSDSRVDLRIDVRDTGIGIPAERIDRLFLPFSQVDSTTTRRFGGTGLGLAISSRLADLMGGTITVSSRSGEGSTFTLRVGFPRADAQAAKAAPRYGEPASMRPLRIILAEDNAVNQVVQLRMLRRLGYSADVVENGVALLAAFEKNRYDVVLLDIQMPVMDGIEAAREIRRRGFDRVRIVALTADVTSETRQASVRVGIDEYVSKPLKLEALADVLTRAEAHFAPVP